MISFKQFLTEEKIKRVSGGSADIQNDDSVNIATNYFIKNVKKLGIDVYLQAFSTNRYEGRSNYLVITYKPKMKYPEAYQGIKLDGEVRISDHTNNPRYNLSSTNILVYEDFNKTKKEIDKVIKSLEKTKKEIDKQASIIDKQVISDLKKVSKDEFSLFWKRYTNRSGQKAQKYMDNWTNEKSIKTNPLSLRKIFGI